MSRRLSRSEARCEAFKLIFEVNQHKDDVDFLFDNLLNEEPKSASSLPYIKATVLGVLEKYDELSEIISQNLSEGWRIERISKVSRAILMLAIYEIKYIDDVPDKVAINEAVELAKKLDEVGAGAFVNGGLAGVLKKS